MSVGRTVALLLLLVPSSVSLGTETPVSGDRPNVLMIVVDDLNDWVAGFGGNGQSITPNFDRLAKRGLRFTNAHCTYTLCNPSRASVLTGTLPSTNGVFGNQQDWRKSVALRDKPTLPDTFRRAGWFTGAAGKIFHANHGGPEGGLTGGHGGRMGFNHPPSWTERYPSKQVQIPDLVVRTGQNWNGLDIWHWDWGPLDHPDAATADGRCADWVTEQLKRKHDRPFFLALGVYAPHGPWYAPRSYFDAHDRDAVELPEVRADDLDDVPAVAKGYVRNRGGLHGVVTRAGLWQEAVHAYLAQVTFADATIGRVLDVLDAGEYAENTIVVLWSDHGWYLGEKQRWHKGGLWEEATRVPFLVVAPGVTTPGTECVRPVSLVDLYPTLLDLCGLEPRPDLDGASLRPLLDDPGADWDRVAITVHGGGDRANYAVRDERWRYIRYHDGSEELYDHERDPMEWTNLASRPEQADRIAALAEHLPRSFASATRPVDEVLTERAPDGSWERYVPIDGDVLPERTPAIVGRNLSFSATLEPTFPDGVVLAQGDRRNGWALLLDSNRPVFARSVAGEITRIEHPTPIRGATRLALEFAAEGTLRWSVGDDERTARLPPITAQPTTGLTVGHETSVVDVERLIGFVGTMSDVRLEVRAAKP